MLTPLELKAFNAFIRFLSFRLATASLTTVTVKFLSFESSAVAVTQPSVNKPTITICFTLVSLQIGNKFIIT